MKNKELFPILDKLNTLKTIKSKAFAYAVFKNIEKIEKELEIFQKLQKQPHPDFVNYENERNLLCILYSKKDEYQNPITIPNPDGRTSRYDIEDVGKYQEEYQVLADKYRYVLDDMDLAKKEYDEFMEKEASIKFQKVKFVDLPEDIDANFLEEIGYMID